jgi:hypothetical protein
MAEIEITDFFGDVIDLMRTRGGIVSITNTPSTEEYVVVVGSLGTLIVENFVWIGTTLYQIRAIDTIAPSFTVKSNALPVGTIWKTGAPYYLHGRFIAIDSQLNQIQNGYAKYPLIYLAENFTSTIDRDPINNVGETAQCSFFFMKPAKYEDWLTVDHYENVIKAMKVLANQFIDLLKANQFIQYDEFTTDDFIRHPKWGLTIEGKGSPKNLFSDNLSGIEVRMNVPILKSINDCHKYEKWKTKKGIS